jgi:CHAD domain-containing protein
MDTAPSPQLTPTLLANAAQHSARVVAAGYLREVSTQFDAFRADPAAGFHDLRVALRRLRTWLRAYRPELDDTVRKKTRRRAARIAHATNEPRDIESMLEWIDAQQDLSARERAGVTWFVERLKSEHAEAEADARKLMSRRAPKLISALSTQLESYWLHRDVDDPKPPASMAEVTRDALTTQAERFERAIDRIESADDASKIHRARIAAKRLRYLLETIAEPAAAPLAEHLTKLQDVLGASHDMHGTVNRIVRELGELGARDARVAARHAMHPQGDGEQRPRLATLRPGLNALIARARDNERRTYAAFRADWSDERIASTVAEIRALGDDLGSRFARAET